MLEYMFVMSKEARVCCGSIGVFFRSFSNSWEFLMLNAFGFGASWQNFSVNNLDNLYAGALRQFTTGWMGLSGLWILIKPLMEGAEGFMLVYFHLCSLGIRVVLFLIVNLICF